jgi:hypothetical protein
VRPRSYRGAIDPLGGRASPRAMSVNDALSNFIARLVHYAVPVIDAEQIFAEYIALLCILSPRRSPVT